MGHQLEFRFDKPESWCPECSPEVMKDGGKPEIFRSLCKFHFREYENSPEFEQIKKNLDALIKERTYQYQTMDWGIHDSPWFIPPKYG